jgi:PTH1 family peptidyl-tRNA hydrolase
VALRRFRDHDRRGSASTLVILGLANPGSEYEGSRHNVGGDAVRLVADRRGVRLVHESRQRALSATVPTPRGPVTLAVPTTFMNESGASLPPLLKRTSIEDLGRLQVKFGGGLAGHNGLRSIAKTLGTNDFSRLRIGIGKPPTKEQGADYVLQRPTGARKTAMAEFVAAAADAIETLLDYEFEDAQQRVNRS